MALTLTKQLIGRVRALAAVAAVLLFASPSVTFAHKAELSSWLTLQRDQSGWVGLLEVRVPVKLLELGVSMADVSRDGKLSEQEFRALSTDYARRVLAALDIRVGVHPAGFKVDKVSWKGQGARTLDIVASIVPGAELPRLEADSEALQVTLRRGGGTVILAVQSQAPWYLSSAQGLALGADRRGLAAPFSLVSERPLRVDLVKREAAP